jgi:hypothetical protein
MLNDFKMCVLLHEHEVMTRGQVCRGILKEETVFEKSVCKYQMLRCFWFWFTPNWRKVVQISIKLNHNPYDPIGFWENRHLHLRLQNDCLFWNTPIKNIPWIVCISNMFYTHSRHYQIEVFFKYLKKTFALWFKEKILNVIPNQSTWLMVCILTCRNNLHNDNEMFYSRDASWSYSSWFELDNAFAIMCIFNIDYYYLTSVISYSFT